MHDWGAFCLDWGLGQFSQTKPKLRPIEALACVLWWIVAIDQNYIFPHVCVSGLYMLKIECRYRQSHPEGRTITFARVISTYLESDRLSVLYYYHPVRLRTHIMMIATCNWFFWRTDKILIITIRNHCLALILLVVQCVLLRTVAK